MQVHLLGPCLRTQFVLLCNWDDATAVTEKIKFLRTLQPTWTSRSPKNLYSHKVRKYKTIKLFIGRALARQKSRAHAAQRNLAVYDHAVVDF